jgi:predicted membrane-bound spermidine synthase
LSRISSAADQGRAIWPQIYLGVALTTLGTLILELSLTRIFSVVFFYHFAFLAISIALFGLGAGGVFSYLLSGWRRNFYFKLGSLAAANSVVVLASLVYLLTRQGGLGWGGLAGIYFMSALPFFFAGAVISMAIGETVARVHRVYFFDLLGAAAGCLLLVPFLNYFGGPNTVLTASVLYAASAAIWFNLAGTVRGRALAVIMALGFVFLIFFNGTKHVIDIRYAKGGRLPHELFSQWNSFSRIGLVRAAGGDYSIIIDADAATGIPDFDFDRLTDDQRLRLLSQGPGFPYQVRPGAKTLIIGPGGGYDVARSLASGSRDITAVEINPIIAATVMQKRFPDLNKRLYFRPEVHIHIEDGRSFVRRSQEKYQVLQATLVDTWASTAAGAFALSENNLYTSDAFRDYLTHLTDDGLMVFTRWGFDPPRESLRLVSLAMDALGDLGETKPWRHVVVIREDVEKLQGWGAQDTVLIFRKPISAKDESRILVALVQDATLHLVYMPGDPIRSPFGDLLLSRDPEQFWRSYTYDVSPVDDDRPFFFYTVQPHDLWNYFTHPASAADYKVNQAVPLLFALVAVSILATAVVLALPPLLFGSRLPKQKGARGFLWYFVCIGIGYILIQVALIQKFILFLGHPTYALTVIVFSMLVSSGLGSFFSRKLLGDNDPARLRWLLLAVTVAVSVLALAASPISQVGIVWPLPLKMLVAVLLIAPAGFLMGMPFPTGLRRLEAWYPEGVRWAWSLNAAASVLGSASAIILAIYVGLRATVLIGGGLYLGALAATWLGRHADKGPVNESVSEGAVARP